MQGLLGQEDRLTALLDARRQSRQIGHSHGTTLAKCACACNARLRDAPQVLLLDEGAR